MLRSVLMLMPEVPAVEERYLFGTGPFVLLAREFNSNFVTHDERRYRFTDEWFAADPRLALGGPDPGLGAPGGPLDDGRARPGLPRAHRAAAAADQRRPGSG